MKWSWETKIGMLHHVMIAEPKRKKKDASSSLEKTQPIKSHRFFVNYRPHLPKLYFLSIKAFPFLALQGVLWNSS